MTSDPEFINGEIREVTLISAQLIGSDAVAEYRGDDGAVYRGVIMGYVKLIRFGPGDPCLIRYSKPRVVFGMKTNGGWSLDAIPSVDHGSEFLPDPTAIVEHQNVST